MIIVTDISPNLSRPDNPSPPRTMPSDSKRWVHSGFCLNFSSLKRTSSEGQAQQNQAIERTMKTRLGVCFSLIPLYTTSRLTVNYFTSNFKITNFRFPKILDAQSKVNWPIIIRFPRGSATAVSQYRLDTILNRYGRSRLVIWRRSILSATSRSQQRSELSSNPDCVLCNDRRSDTEETWIDVASAKSASESVEEYANSMRWILIYLI